MDGTIPKPMPRINEVNRPSITLTGPEIIRRLLLERGFSLRSWADKHGEFHSQVSRCINNERRPLSRIRNKLARTLRMKREQIDNYIEAA